MAEQATNSVAALMGITSLLSLAALFYLFQKHIDGRSLLSYEPRRSVPWGPAVALVGIALPLFGLLVYLAMLPEAAPQVEPSAEDSELAVTWGNFAFMIMFVVGVGAWITAFFRADARDFGLPTSFQQATQDIGIGCLATLASFLPIYAVQLTLIFSLDIKTKHPLVEQVEENQSISMMILAIAMAVIAAPLYEEFTFRCLFQGWLEKYEDEAVGFGNTYRHDPDEEFVSLDFYDPELAAQTPQAHVPHGTSYPDEEANLVERHTPGLIRGLPHGWTPILISGIVFGLAHVGHGVAPISLILFGIVLGYLYQRTHRLLPCIAAHMLFNGYSMLLLWLQLKPAGE